MRGRESPLFISDDVMNTEGVKQRLIDLLDQRFENDPEHFIVDVTVAGNKVQAFIDGDNGVKIEKCAETSRYLEKYLDEELLLGEKYVLEVSSPGMTRPLKVLRQYKRRINSEVKVVKRDGVGIEGVLKAADEERIVVEQVVFQKKKEISRETFEIPYSDIKSTKLKLNF